MWLYVRYLEWRTKMHEQAFKAMSQRYLRFGGDIRLVDDKGGRERGLA